MTRRASPTIMPLSETSDAFREFYECVNNGKADRKSDSAIGRTEIQRDPPQEEASVAGDRISEFTKVLYRSTQDLTKLVMLDNTIGKVYPGSLLWAAPVRGGRLQQLETIRGRPLVTVSFTGTLTGDSSASTTVFRHDGTFSDFINKAKGLLAAQLDGGARLAADFKVSSSLEDALLSIGLSAHGWGASASAGLDHIRDEKRSVAIMTLDQVYYSAAVDPPAAEGFLPSRVLRNDEELAASLARGAKAGGEVAYIRKVDYGRRILISLSADATIEELRAAVRVAVAFVSGGLSSSVDDKTKKLWQSVEGKLIIIGGTYPDGVNPFFGGDFASFQRAIQAIMDKKAIHDSFGAIPISFELAYEIDNSPMQVFETVEFAGKLPGRSWGRTTERFRVSTNGGAGDAAVIQGDDEIASNDWTLVELTGQSLQLSPDRREISFDLVWKSFEGNDDQTLGDTIIESRKKFRIAYTKPVRAIISSPTSFGAHRKWYAGAYGNDPNVNSRLPFPDNGLLSNIRVRFDGPSDDDHNWQFLEADLAYDIWLEDGAKGIPQQ